jgi:uncharacterized protein YodC (DUF2158 family)
VWRGAVSQGTQQSHSIACKWVGVTLVWRGAVSQGAQQSHSIACKWFGVTLVWRGAVSQGAQQSHSIACKWFGVSMQSTGISLHAHMCQLKPLEPEVWQKIGGGQI